MTAPSREEFDLHFRWLDDKWEGYLKIFDAKLDRQATQFAEWKEGQTALFAGWKEGQTALFAEWKVGQEALLARFEKLADSRQARIDERFTEFDKVVREIKSENAAMRVEIAEGRAESRNELRSMKVFMVTTAIAIVGGIAAFNATVLSNMVASFDSGKETALAISAATEQLKQVQAAMISADARRQTAIDDLSTLESERASSTRNR